MKDDLETLKHLEAYKTAVAESKSAYVIGSDECGTGSWAGPLYVCAAAVPVDWKFPGVADSKKLTQAKREEIYYWLRSNLKLRFQVATAEVEEIDRLGLGKALKRCYIEALQKLRKEFPTAHIVVDGEVQLEGIKYQHFPRADGHIQAVSAASIYAKVLRDRAMIELGKKYPGYGIADSMGYGTPKHREAVNRLGPCPIHRISYGPFAKYNTSLEEEVPGMSIDTSERHSTIK